MVGLKTVTGEAASLLLNMEAVFTALLAWFAFKENFDRRLLLGMIAIVAGGIFLAWQPGNTVSLSFGGMLVIGACFCWAMDNNLTRKISHADPVQIATVKGLFAGLINASIALFAGTQLPDLSTIVKIIVVGFVGYGLSLVLYIKALRNLGTARTGAYFSTAPFVGAILSFLFLGESINANLAFAAALMAFGVWLHLTEVHEHKHSHVVEEHEHLHRHDEHHQHEHGPDIPPGEPHSHWHRHEAITHAHAHYPDTHHQHHH
jgi:drug/metabolite transporter (DMT)-like permease